MSIWLPPCLLYLHGYVAPPFLIASQTRHYNIFVRVAAPGVFRYFMFGRRPPQCKFFFGGSYCIISFQVLEKKVPDGGFPGEATAKKTLTMLLKISPDPIPLLSVVVLAIQHFRLNLPHQFLKLKIRQKPVVGLHATNRLVVVGVRTIIVWWRTIIVWWIRLASVLGRGRGFFFAGRAHQLL